MTNFGTRVQSILLRFSETTFKVLGTSKTFLVGSVVLCLISLLQDEYPDLCITNQFSMNLASVTVFIFGLVSDCKLPTVMMSINK